MTTQGAHATEALVQVGRFGAAHGVKGELRLISFTQDKAAILTYGPLCDAAGARSFAILSARRLKDGAYVVRLAGVADRTSAEGLTNLDLFVPRSRLPAPAEEEFYIADLIGLAAVDPEGSPIGTVTDVLDHGAGSILEIRPAAGGETLLFPFTHEVAPQLDFALGRIVIVMPVEVEADEAGADGPDESGGADRAPSS